MAHAQHISEFDTDFPSLPPGWRAGGMRALSGKVLASLKEAESLWRKMESLPHAGIHQSYDWCAAWADTPGATIRIVVIMMNGEPAALVPFEIVHRGGVRIARLIGTRHSNANSPIFTENFLEAVDTDLAEAFAGQLKTIGLEADLIIFDKLRPTYGPYLQPLLMLPNVTSQNSSFQLPLLSDFEATLQQLNAKRRRKKFRVSQRRLATLGEYRYEIAQNEEVAQNWLAKFFEQKSVRLKAQGLPDVFADSDTRAAFSRLASFEKNLGNPPLALHAIVLEGESGAQPIALAGMTQKDGHVTCQFSSIDGLIAADASVGELLFYHMIERACAEGRHTFDFGVGDQPYKHSWCPVQTGHADIFIPLNAKGHMAGIAMSVLVHVKRITKTSPRLHRMAARIRAVLLRGKTSDKNSEG